MRLPSDDLAGRTWTLTDRLGGQSFDRGGDELSADRLYVAIGPWDSNLLALTA